MSLQSEQQQAAVPYTVPLFNSPSHLVSAASSNKEIEIETRLLRLIEFSKLTESLRDETELAKQMIKNKIHVSFENVQASLRRLEDKLYNQIESQLFDRIMEMSLRSIQYDLNQLIGKLTSMTLLSDQQHEFMMNYVDGSLKQLEKNYRNIESYKRAELDKFKNGNGGRQDVNNIIRERTDKINKFFEAEYLNLNTEVNLKSNCNEKTSDDYREWLVSDSKTDSKMDTKVIDEAEELLQKQNLSNSFDFVDFEKELDSIDIDDECYCNEDKRSSSGSSNSSSTISETLSDSKNAESNKYIDSVMRIFNEILNKPNDYWLLKPSSN